MPIPQGTLGSKYGCSVCQTTEIGQDVERVEAQALLAQNGSDPSVHVGFSQVQDWVAAIPQTSQRPVITTQSTTVDFDWFNHANPDYIEAGGDESDITTITVQEGRSFNSSSAVRAFATRSSISFCCSGV